MMAPLMNVGWLRMKSSAVSVSSVSEAGGWDSAPSRPSGVPVLKKKRSAQAGVASHTPTINVTAIRASVLIDHSPFESFDIAERMFPPHLVRFKTLTRSAGGDRTEPSWRARRASQRQTHHPAPYGRSHAGATPGSRIAGQEMGAHRVHVEPEHLADVDEREGPLAALAAHPGRGLGGQTTGAKVPAPASILDAPYRVLQNREHEGARSGRVAIPARAPEHRCLPDRWRLAGCHLEGADHRLPSI